MDNNWRPPKKTLIGVIGGMGPAASARLYQYVVELKPCTGDDEHVPLLIYNNPQIPNNNQAILKTGPPSLPAMIYTAKMLERAGATHIAIPCNTAHVFALDLQKAIEPLPLINMLQLTAEFIISDDTQKEQPVRVGLMATSGTIQSKIFQKILCEVAGGDAIDLVAPTERSQQIIQKCITRIKAGEQEEVCEILMHEAQALIDLGVDLVVIGCTELPLVLTPERTAQLSVHVVDPMRVLAHEIIRISSID